MPDLHPFEVRLAASWPPTRWRDVAVLAAVSGGADSVALLRALAALRKQVAVTGRADSAVVGDDNTACGAGSYGALIVAHVNHGLRGAEADADAAFVLELAGRLDLDCEVARPCVDRVGPGDGLEAAARQARYRALAEIAERRGARYVATAHTADDQAETVLHRLLRGTGLAGLAGIPRARPLASATVLRPMLGLRRREVLEYLADLGQPYREDASNAERRHTRNRLRHDLLPQLAAQYNPGVVDALLRLSHLAGEAQRAIHTRVEELADASIRALSSGGIEIAAAPLAGQSRYLLREVIALAWRRADWPRQAMGYTQWDLLAGMLLGETAVGNHPARETGEGPRKRVFPGAVVAERNADGLQLHRAAND